MIYDRILEVIHSSVKWLLGGILAQPDVTQSSGFSTAVSHLLSYVAAFNAILPTGTIFLGLSFIVVAEVSILGFQAIKFLYKKIPGIK